MSGKAGKHRACQFNQSQVSCNGSAGYPREALNNKNKEHNNVVSLAGSMVLQICVHLNTRCLLPADRNSIDEPINQSHLLSVNLHLPSSGLVRGVIRQ